MTGVRAFQKGMTDESFVEIHNAAEKFTQKRKKGEIKVTKIETIAEEDKSDGEEKEDTPGKQNYDN